MYGGGGSSPGIQKLGSVVDLNQEPSIDATRNRSDTNSKDSKDQSLRQRIAGIPRNVESTVKNPYD